MNSDIQIGMIGLGKLGLSCAEVFAEYYTVKGYDIKEKESSKVDVVKSLNDVVKKSHFIFIVVPTPHSHDYSGETPAHNLPPRDFDYSSVIDVLKQLNNIVTKDQTVVLVSTILPGTIREQLAPLLTNNALIYHPYFTAMGTEKQDMETPDLIVIGSGDGVLNDQINNLIKLYNPIIKNDPQVNICTWEEAEAIKMFYNTFISLKLCFVNTIQDVAVKIGNINVNRVMDGLIASTQRILSSKYMYPGLGGGGPCHPRDSIALRFLSEKLNLGYDFFQSIVEGRDKQAKNFANFIISVAKKHNLPVILHGKTYKRGLNCTQGSYSLLVNFYLEHEGIKTKFVDPLTDPLTEPIAEPAIFVLTHPVNTEYLPYCDFPLGSIIIDPWRIAKDMLTLNVIDYGNNS